MIIQHAVWLYFRFPLILRDVEDLLAERGIDASYESVRRWSVKFVLSYANGLRRSRPRPDARWHLDEMFVSINGKRLYLWRAVDSDTRGAGCPGSVAQKQAGSRQADAQTVEKQGFVPDAIVTDKLPSYGAALKDLGLAKQHDFGA